jgi:hypothetical protein
VLLNYAETDGTGDALVFIHGLTLHWQDMGLLMEPMSQNIISSPAICAVTESRAIPARGICSVPTSTMLST